MTNLKAPTPVGPYSMFRYLGDNSDWVTGLWQDQFL